MPKLDRRALLLSAAGLMVAGRTAIARIPPLAAGTFLDSVGVNVHIGSEPYRGNFDRFRRLLADSGIRHLRDELRPGNDLDRWRALNAELGIRFNILVSPATNTVPDMMAYLEAFGVPRVSAIEGQNEGDSDWFMSLPIARPDWSKTVIDYQKSVHRALRARYGATELPIISPSVIDWKPADAKLLSPAADFCDMVALHAYVQRGQEPETEDDYASIAWYLRNMRDTFKPGAEVLATEMGYCNTTRPGGSGVSERAAAIYLPRMLLNNYSRGIRRTFLYEFMNGGVDPSDGEQNWGLVRSNGAPKPSYHAIRRLLSGLADARAVAQPSQLTASVDTPSTDVRQVALQDSNGTSTLAIWRTLRSWDVDKADDIENDSTPVELVIDSNVKSVFTNVPNDDEHWRALTKTRDRISVPVADKVVLLRFA